MKSLKGWQHILIICLITLSVTAGLAFLFFHVNFLGPASSIEREYIDRFMKILLSIASLFFSVVVVVVGYSLLVFRRRPGDEADGPPMDNYRPLEQAWTAIPLLIVIGLAVYGGYVLDRMTAPGTTQADLEIDVLAFRFGWLFSYPDYSVTSYELHVPVDQRVVFRMESVDVVHAFWVREWGPKQDIVPGMRTEVRYTPTQTGQYAVECSQLCGYGHTAMTAPVYVTPMEDFRAWIREQQFRAPAVMPVTSPAPSGGTFGALAAAGSGVFDEHCAACHGAGGEGLSAPALIGPNHVLAHHQTADSLLDYISAYMPLHAPGSLTHQQYIEVLALLLVRNNRAAEPMMFSENELASIGLALPSSEDESTIQEPGLHSH